MFQGSAAFAELVTLAAAEVVVEADVNGWSIDVWDMSGAALAALKDLYTSVITGDIEADLVDALDDDGIDVVALFYDERDTETRHRTTRADLSEFAAAAAWVAVNMWPLDTLHMPNMPKDSRDRSESGIDVMSLVLDDGAHGAPLVDGEMLYVGSVKHTISDLGDLRRKLVNSIDSTSELTQAYMLRQLRVFVERLRERGIAAQRAFLFLGEELSVPSRVMVALAGAADSALRVEYLEEIENLPQVTADRCCRLLLIPNISDLQDLVAHDA